MTTECGVWRGTSTGTRQLTVKVLWQKSRRATQQPSLPAASTHFECTECAATAIMKCGICGYGELESVG